MKDVLKNIMTVIGSVLLVITLIFGIGMTFGGFRNKTNYIFNVVPEKQLLDEQDKNENMERFVDNCKANLESLNLQKNSLEKEIIALESASIQDAETIASLRNELVNVNNEIERLNQQISGITANVNNAIITCMGVYPRISYWASNGDAGYYEACLSGTEQNPMPSMSSDARFIFEGKEQLFNLFINSRNNHFEQARIEIVETYNINIQGYLSSMTVVNNTYYIAEDAEISLVYRLDGVIMDKESVIAGLTTGMASYEAIINYTLDENNMVNTITYELRATPIY